MATTKPGGVYRGVDGKLRDANGNLLPEPIVTTVTPEPAVVLAPNAVLSAEEAIPAEPVLEATPKSKSKKASKP